MPVLDPDLVRILACPLTKAPVFEDGGRLVSTDPETRKVYRIDDGIPVMLLDESAELGAEEHAEAMKRQNAQPWSPPNRRKGSE